MKKILTINPGSTGTKYKLFDLKGNLVEERIFSLKDEKKEKKFLKRMENLEKIAVRVVHGGDVTKPTLVNAKLKKHIINYTLFAPIHNNYALESIERVEKFFPKVPLYACFDTSFHTSIGKEFTTYALPQALTKKYKLKKYGFHGLALESALSLFKKSAETKKYKRIVIAHLGGGSSVTAVKNGKSFATSMELTPLSGTMMITRSGNVDPEIPLLFLKGGMSEEQVSDLLNNKSGFLGLTGSRDTLRIFEKAQKGSEPEKLAFDIFVNQIVEKIYAYAGLMGGIDALLFTGGIGYGNSYIRKEVAKKLKLLGISKKDIYPILVDEGRIMFEKIKKI